MYMVHTNSSNTNVLYHNMLHYIIVYYIIIRYTTCTAHAAAAQAPTVHGHFLGLSADLS